MNSLFPLTRGYAMMRGRGCDDRSLTVVCGSTATHKPGGWVQSLITCFDSQVLKRSIGGGVISDTFLMVNDISWLLHKFHLPCVAS